MSAASWNKTACIRIFFPRRSGMPSTLISTHLAVFRLQQEMCNQHLYLTHQKGGFLGSVISGLPGAPAARCSPSTPQISAQSLLLKTCRIFFPSWRRRWGSFCIQRKPSVPLQPQRPWYIFLSLLWMDSVKKLSKGWLRKNDSYPAAWPHGANFNLPRSASAAHTCALKATWSVLIVTCPPGRGC